MKGRLYLIAYDIADPKRLGRVARYISRSACRIQYSVFAGQLSQSELKELLTDLREIIDPAHDDIRVYPLPAAGEVALSGKQFFATNTLLMQNGHSRLELIQDADHDK